MSVFDDLGKGVGVMLHPWENTKKNMDIGEAYAVYYKTTAVPLVVYILASLLLTSVAGSIFAFRHVLAPLVGLGWLSAIIIPIALVWVVIPIGIFLNAAVVHIVGKVSKQFKGGFDKTLTATMYSKLPVAIFSFILAIPFAIPTIILFGIWSFLVSLASYANQQKIDWITVLGLEVITLALALAVLGIVATVLAISLGASAGQFLMMHSTAIGAT